MAKDLNKVMIIGRLGMDPEMRHTPSGSPVTTFRVATSREWRDTSGERHEETEWFSVVAWNKLAEICNQYLARGARVYIEGRLQTRSWEDQQTGQTRYKTEVVANDMIILDSRSRDEFESPSRSNARPHREPERDHGPGTGYPEFGDEDIPF